MIIDTPVVSRFDAAVTLRVELGYLRGNWDDFLADCESRHQSISGITLLPCARKHDGRGLRPVYAVSDIKEFVTRVRTAVPTATKAPIRPIVLAIDRAKSWRLNTFLKTGAPMPH